MKTLYFITSNRGKIDILNLFVHELDPNFSFEMLKLDFEELKTDDSLERTALNKANTCLELTKKDNVVVSDAGIFIEELNGFPGVNTGFVMRTIDNEGILKLMEGKTNRKAFFQVSMALARPDGTREVFTGRSDIEIADSIKGEHGFSWDTIALGDGERFSDNINNPKRLHPFKESLKQLLEFLKNEK